jgi:hypothetical protein
VAFRLATVADIPVIEGHLAAMPNPPYREDVAAILAHPDEHVIIEDVSGVVCRISVSRQLAMVQVIWLLPRAKWTADNASLLAKLLTRVLRRIYDRLSSAERQWTIRADFQAGRNRLGQLDGGRELCEFWRDVIFTSVDGLTKADVRNVGTAPSPRYEISMTVAAATVVGEAVANNDALVAARIAARP